MSIVDQALSGNAFFQTRFEPQWAERVKPKLAVVTCMDARLSRLDAILRIESAEVQIVRNGGAAVTEDALRSLIVSTQMLGTPEILILAHRNCAFCGLDEHALAANLKDATGVAHVLPSGFHTFDDPVAHVRSQVLAVRRCPWIPAHVSVRGAVYDVETGALHEVEAEQV